MAYKRPESLGTGYGDVIMKLVASQQIIKGASTPVDAANALAVLVSEDAGFITGQILDVDGGFTRSGDRMQREVNVMRVKK
jgi:NAD(P)-dependent dehydrogenase (short-subunit alcohol dehydrogenase family)